MGRPFPPLLHTCELTGTRDGAGGRGRVASFPHISLPRIPQSPATTITFLTPGRVTLGVGWCWTRFPLLHNRL